MNANIRNLNNIINHINSIKKGSYNKQGICVLIGAGADISSGGILFRELKLRFLKENGCSIPTNIEEKMLDEKFEKRVNELSQDDRCETLDKIMRKYKQPSEGYSLLVMLAELGYINAVITTNFDYLLEETQELLNLKPFTIYTPGRAIPEEYYLQRNKIPPIYLKMHGDLSDRLVTHLTQSEIQSRQYGENFIKLFTHIIQNNSIIIVGYGGYDHLITQIFTQQMNYIDEVYWCNIHEPKEDSGLAKALEQKNKLCYVKTSFDKLFQELARDLLKKEKLKNVNPIFLPTVVQSKIENQKALFIEKIKYSDKLIKRVKAQEILENFLCTFENKCIAVVGDYKFGKSCFVYKAMQSIQDVTFLPIIYNPRYSILENMAQALGYDTDVPFSIMYSFLKWWNEKEEHLVFIMDDFFNHDYFHETAPKYIIEFFNLLYISREFKFIQFIITFQNNIYDEITKNNVFITFNNIISEQIKIEKFSEYEVEKLLKKYDADSNVNILKKQELLHIPYVWEIINKNNITLSNDINFFEQYVDALYNKATKQYDFTKHALNTTLGNLSYSQLFHPDKQVDTSSNEYKFLKEEGMIDTNNEIIYPELAIYFCRQYILNSDTWEEVIYETIIPDIKKNKILSDMQIEVYVLIWANVEDIDKFSVILRSLESIIANNSLMVFQKKIITKVLQKCVKSNKELFEKYLKSINIDIYSLDLQRYLFKICAELCPEVLSIWVNFEENGDLSYASFILSNDSLYNSLKSCLRESILETEVLDYFKQKNGLVKLCHILTYWGWDNLSGEEYKQLSNTIVHNIFPSILIGDDSIQYFVNILIKYAYNIFFNAGKDFEEEFVRCRNEQVFDLIKCVLAKRTITENDYMSLLMMNININNSWLFIISNIIVVQVMHNHPNETYDMLYHFWDKIQDDVKAQNLDFYLSSVFWSLYLNEPCDRIKFATIFEKVVEKYERILFMFPSTKREASINKFAEEFDRMFEDGFNPIAFYFYTAPYKSLTTPTHEWKSGKTDLKLYWDLAKSMSDFGKFDDMLRIVHALGQMISIYPEEGYSALENLTGFDQPIIKRGIIRIFKENYLRYSSITKKELKKSLFHFEIDDIEKIIYNTDFLLENRTLEQLHWSRLFYNLEQLLNINVSEIFLSKILYSESCSEFLRDFISEIFQHI